MRSSTGAASETDSPSTPAASDPPEAGLDVEDVQGVLAAVAPTVGTARVAKATGNIVQALGLAIGVAELALEES